MNYICQMIHKEYALLKESIPYVNLHRCNQTYLYPNMNVYGDNVVRKRVLLRFQVLYLFNMVFVCILGRCALVLLAEASYVEANVLRKVLGTASTILMKLVQYFLLN